MTAQTTRSRRAASTGARPRSGVVPASSSENGGAAGMPLFMTGSLPAAEANAANEATAAVESGGTDRHAFARADGATPLFMQEESAPSPAALPAPQAAPEPTALAVDTDASDGPLGDAVTRDGAKAPRQTKPRSRRGEASLASELPPVPDLALELPAANLFGPSLAELVGAHLPALLPEPENYTADQARERVRVELVALSARTDQAVAQIGQLVTTERERWQGAHQDLQTNVVAAATAAGIAVQSSARATSDALGTLIEDDKAEIGAARDAASASVSEKVPARIDALVTSVTEDADQLRSAGVGAGGAADSAGGEEVEHAELEIRRQQELAEAVGTEKRNDIHDAEAGLAEAKRAAVDETASETVAKVGDAAEPLREFAGERAGELSRAMEGAGDRAADELLAGVEPVQGAFDAQVVDATATLGSFADQSLTPLEGLGERAIRNVGELETSTLAKLEVTPGLVVTESAAALHEAERALESAGSEITGRLRGDSDALEQTLLAIPRPDPAAAAFWVEAGIDTVSSTEQQATLELEALGDDVAAGFSQQTAQSRAALSTLESVSDAELSALSQQSAQLIALPVAATVSGLGEIENSVVKNADEAIAETEALVGSGSSQALGGFDSTVADTRGAISENVGTGIASNAELVTDLPTAVDTAVATAADEYDDHFWETGLKAIGSALSWLGDKIAAIGRALWNMVTDPGFWVGLAIGVGLALLAAGTIASGGLLAVAVGAAIGAAAAAGGTVVSNLYHGRPWHEHLLRNTFIGAAALAGVVAGPLVLGSMSTFGAGLVGLEIATVASTIIANKVEGRPWNDQLLENMVIFALFHTVGAGVQRGVAGLRGTGKAPPETNTSGTTDANTTGTATDPTPGSSTETTGSTTETPGSTTETPSASAETGSTTETPSASGDTAGNIPRPSRSQSQEPEPTEPSAPSETSGTAPRPRSTESEQPREPEPQPGSKPSAAREVPTPTAEEYVKIDAYAEHLSELRSAVADDGATAAAESALDAIESLAVAEHGKPGSPYRNLLDHIDTLTTARQRIQAGEPHLWPIEEPPGSGRYVEGIGRRFKCQSAGFKPFRGRTYSSIETEMGGKPTSVEGGPPPGAAVRLTWRLGDGSLVHVDAPGSGNASPYMINRAPHVARTAPIPNQGLHLSDTGVGVPVDSTPAHIEIVPDALFEARIRGK